jgi:hypothetical protein
MLVGMRRMAWPLASTLLALSACNALTGVSELSTCPSCDDTTELDAGVAADGARLPDAATTGDVAVADARDGATKIDATSDAADAADAAPLGCEGALACVRVMFATSVGYTGNLGGIAGADAKCQALADVSTTTRVQRRTFVAWVSTAASPVTTRLAHGTLAYIRTDGVTIASSFTDLTDNSLQNGISLDENGGNRSGVGAWTATSSNGAGYSGNSCTDWTLAVLGIKGDTGNVGGAGNGWSAGGPDDCTSLHSLYCVEK